MVPLRALFKSSELRQPASPEAIAQAEQALGVSLPQQLRNLYNQTNGVFGDWTVTIFEVESLFERNETYGVSECLPHLLYIGNDNGNQGVFVPRSSSEFTVFESDLGDQSIEGLVTLAPNLSNWFEHGCPWSDGELGAPRHSTET